ncbi:transposase [Staphylococcus phage Machias]|nr:transposase [Staphylococcus phage Machias]
MINKNGKLVKSFKTRIYPNQYQKDYFNKCFGVRRKVWNMALEDYQNRNDDVKFNGFNYQKRLNNEIFESGKYPYLFEVNSMIRQEALKDLNQKFVEYYNKQKKSRKTNDNLDPEKFKPKFKKKKHSNESFRFMVKDRKKLPVKILGSKRFSIINMRGKPWLDIKSKESLNFINSNNHRFLTYTISRKNEKYYISVTYEINNYKKPREKSDSIGIDMGMKTPLSCVDSNGKTFEFKIPHGLWIQERKTEKLQEKLSSKKYYSKSYYKTLRQLRKSYNKECNILEDYRDKITNWLVKNYKVINIEPYSHTAGQNFKNMRRSNKRFGKWDFLENKLKNKCEEYDNELNIITKRKTTQTCSSCGYVRTNKDRLVLGDEIHDCPNCEVVLDRDSNAAKNILDLKYV